MKVINVTTGFGYYKDKQGYVIAKAELPISRPEIKDVDGNIIQKQIEHEIDDTKYDYVEVGSQAVLDAITVWIDPAEQLKKDNEQKIQKKIRDSAIAKLKADGDLPADYEDE